MDKFLITKRAYNKKLGPIMVTTSARTSCPKSCPLSRRASGALRGTCYAEHGFIGAYMWANLDRVPLGGSFKKGQIKVHGFDDLIREIRLLPEGAIWRHNQAGDLASVDGVTIDRQKLRQLTDANRGRRGFTFTHYPVLDNAENRDVIKEANENGFAVNLSADTLDQADQLANLNIGPITALLPKGTTRNTKTPEGRTVVVCPATRGIGMTCATCGICTMKRKAIIGFPVFGRQTPRTNQRRSVSSPAPINPIVERELQRLFALRSAALVTRNEIDTIIADIDTELAAITAYERTRKDIGLRTR